VIFLMWVVMMVGLMLPGSVPMIFLFSTINRKMRSGSFVPAGLFVLGYIALDRL
jgi:predicted metal-binding membrane protein